MRKLLALSATAALVAATLAIAGCASDGEVHGSVSVGVGYGYGYGYGYPCCYGGYPPGMIVAPPVGTLPPGVDRPGDRPPGARPPSSRPPAMRPTPMPRGGGGRRR